LDGVFVVQKVTTGNAFWTCVDKRTTKDVVVDCATFTDILREAKEMAVVPTKTLDGNDPEFM
jgi:hypothetical protein